MDNKESGFIKIYRTFFDHFLWDEDREFSKAEAWIDLLRTARYKEGTKSKIVNGEVIEWGRGELLASVRFLKERWGWNSTGKVTRFLDMLEKQNMVLRKTEQGVTVVSICNYDIYNDLETTNGTATEREQNTDRTDTEREQVQNSKKDKKVKKEKNIHTPPDFEEVKAYFKEKGYDNGLAKKFYSYYQEPMEDRGGRVWKDQNGNTVKSWKQKAIAVWMKDGDKSNPEPKGFELLRKYGSG